MKKHKKNVFPQMFDVRPVDKTGDLDLKKITSLSKTVILKSEDEFLQAENFVEEPKKELREDIVFHNSIDDNFSGWEEMIREAKQKDEANQSQKKKRPELKESMTSEFVEEQVQIKNEKITDHFAPVEVQRKDPEPIIEERIKSDLMTKIVQRRKEIKTHKEVFFADNFPEKVKSQEVELKTKTFKEVRYRVSPEAEIKSISKKKAIKKSLPLAKKNYFWKSIFSNYRKLDGVENAWFSNVGKPAFAFASVGVVMLLILASFVYVSYGLQIKNNIQVLGQQAIGDLESAKNQLEDRNFESAEDDFSEALTSFSQAQKQIDILGGDMLDIFSGLPWLSKVSSGKNVVAAGKELTESAKEISQVISLLGSVKNPLDMEQEEKTSLLEIFLSAEDHLAKGKIHLAAAQGYVDKVQIDDLPVEYQEKFRKLQTILPLAVSMMDEFSQHSEVFLEILGHNGPRKYLLIFQNNHEIRATGGFIGSYGLLHIADGQVKKLFIDGIFNPDGQFDEDIIPPRPLQKITAGWSTHDANWFPNFPTSARKIASFYEKTGGPTVDGVITLTPDVMKRLLDVTGPIEMSEYGVIIDKDNFIEETQYKVEVDYDREENRPKKFLADLAPEILKRVFAVSDANSASKVIAAFSDSLSQKDILIYSADGDVQRTVSQRGWSGEIYQTKRDFLMVVNTNINGYKTDGVIDESISHSAEIASDGSVINTVKIKRVHNGGDTEYEWWNKVNSNYMRVYVPQGSELISVSGQTREFIEAPLDYEKLGFKEDEWIASQENSMTIDEESGTRIYEEDGKTVFANWTYVSPKEEMEIEYVYKTPLKVSFSGENDNLVTYSLLAQKQPGSRNSSFRSMVKFDDDANVVWQFPSELEVDQKEVSLETKLDTDKFVGFILQKK